jgi:hypothetical protein
MKNQRLQERKEELKQLALDGRKFRRENGCGWTPYSDQARYKHIAYCMARGRDYLEIENKVHDCNKISSWRWETINKDIEYLKEGFDEDVCASA